MTLTTKKLYCLLFFFFQAEDGIRDGHVTGVQTCALPICSLTFDQMVHDVTDEEVEEEIQRTLDRQGNWEEVEDEITEEHRVTVDAVTIGEDGEPIEEERDENQVLDLR